ncbi:MAG: VapE domain-containing protein, partial [Bacteroidales bacterium]
MEGDWKDSLSVDDKGNLTKSISNYRAIFTHDENLSQIRFDTFCQDDISFSPLFLNVNGNKVDEESVGKIQDYLEQTYQLRLTQNKVFELLKTTASERSYNPVQEFIRKEMWDGMPRIETAIIDYLGAEDTPLVREQTKLWFVAAVARAFEPGCKFDNVLTLPGPQGIGKSTFFKTIGDRWFNDSFSFASGDKEKVETITNGWIIEISELNGMKRANDAEAAKAFLSRRSDSMRPAYGRKVVEFLRHNVFAATTNETNFLQGDNGNRRWWIITVNGNGHVSTWLPQLHSA